MIAVPEAALLPIVPRRMRDSNSRMSSGGKPWGNTGNGRSSTSPISSQWPVTESLPGEASAILPKAARGAASCGGPMRATRPRPSDRSAGTRSGASRAMLPSVSLPRSPYAPASGNSPAPTLSSTIRMTRRMAAGGVSALVCGVVVAHRARRADRRDGVLEHHVVGAAMLDDDGEAVEILDAPLELRAVHQPHEHREFFAARVIEKDVLNVGLCGGGLGVTCLGHRCGSP